MRQLAAAHLFAPPSVPKILSKIERQGKISICQKVSYVSSTSIELTLHYQLPARQTQKWLIEE